MAWLSDKPEKCQLCPRKFKDGDRFVDGVTVYGTWAIMCLPCHKEKGHGLGSGNGQEYDFRSGEKVR